MKQVLDEGGAENKTDLAAGHADLDLIYHFLRNYIALLDLRCIDTQAPAQQQHEEQRAGQAQKSFDHDITGRLVYTGEIISYRILTV